MYTSVYQPSLVQAMAHRVAGANSSSEPMLEYCQFAP